MASPPPTKPPRGVKQGKETSGVLMSVIRTLSASETNEQREKERVKLEEEYRKSDARLDGLVAAHADRVADVMGRYRAAGAALAEWSAREAGARARLAACRGLLRVRHDDLRRLWTDARTHTHALAALARIELVAGAEREVRGCMARGRVLAAATRLAEALHAAASPTAAPGLVGTVDRLRAAEDELAGRVQREMCLLLFATDESPCEELHRQGSTGRRIAALLDELTGSSEATEARVERATPELESSLGDGEGGLETRLAILLEALAVLGRLEDATERFKVRMQEELLEVVARVSRDLEREEGEDDAELAGRLVWALRDVWVACAERLRRAAPVWTAALARPPACAPAIALPTERHYWSAVQRAMQLVVSDYVDAESTRGGAERGAGEPGEPRPSTADHFRKRAPRRRTRLYRLHAAPPPAAPARPSRAARPDLPTAALPALRSLAERAEAASGERSLRAFLAERVRGAAADALAARVRAEVDAAAGDPRAWRDPAPPPGVPGEARLVCACAGVAWAAVERGAARCGAAAWCGGAEAARALLPALASLGAHARAARRPPPRTSHAARWLADDDIVRFLQGLSNWRAAVGAVEAAEDGAYEREAEILGGSLGDAEAARGEAPDPELLASHALLCETAEWLAGRVREVPGVVSMGAGERVSLGESLLRELEEAALVFQRLSHECLLYLHLELRIQCFHHLGSESGAGGEEGAAGGGGAARLAAALLAFHDRVGPVLAPRRLAYVVGGLGEMMSAGVVWRWQGTGSGEGAEAQLALLRHCLASLALPADGLARAGRYLALLSSSPQDIVAAVRARGPAFSELEYLNAFKHIAARRRLSPADLRPHLDALSQALALPH